MRNRTIALVAAALAALPAAAAAQARTDAALQQASAPALAADPRVAPAAEAAEAPAAAPAVAAPAALPQARRARASTGRRVLLTLGGAIVGGWAGYLGSQVTRSDWDKENNGDFASYRMGFTVGGAALGAVTGLLVGRGGRDEGGLSRPSSAVREPESSRDVIRVDEIRTSSARTALELVQTLRPQWLQRRGIQNPTETGRGEQVGDRGVRVTPGQGGIKVYLDNALLGEESALREIPTSTLGEVRWMDAAAATYRFGSGHTHGAIILTTARMPQ